MGLRYNGAGLPHRGGASMDHPVGFIDGSLSTLAQRLRPHRLEADLGSTQHGYSVYEFQVNGS